MNNEQTHTTSTYLQDQEALLNLAKKHRQNLPVAIEYIDKAIALSIEYQDKNFQAKALNFKGGLFWQKGEYGKAKSFLIKALKIREELGDKDQLVAALSNVGSVYFFEGNYAKTFEYYLKAVMIKENTDDLKGLGRCYYNLGVVLGKQGNYDNAVEYYEKAATIRKSIKDNNGLAEALKSLGSIRKAQRDFEGALGYYLQSIKLLKEEYNEGLLANVSYEIGETYNYLGQFEKGIKYLFVSLEAQEKLNNKNELAICLLKIGRAYQQQQHFKNAIVYLKRSKQLMEKHCLRNCMGEVLTELSEAYIGLGQYEQAIVYLKERLSYQEEVFDKKKTQVIAELQTKYETEKKNFEIKTLQQERKHLQTINEELGRFAGKAAHDLKSPLSTIGFSSLLRKKYAENLDEKGQEYLQYIEGGASRMQQLIIDLLQYAKTGTDIQNRKQIDLNEVINVVVNNLLDSINDSAAQITYPQLPTVYATETGMIQLFQNIIGNSIKFKGVEQPSIQIQVTETETAYHFSLQDNGIGISPEYQTSIFETFNKLHSVTEYEGTGLGLAICKKVIENLGGEIGVKSEEGKGSTFFFNIPKN